MSANPARIRLATEADADSILAIYAPIVRDTVISFEYQPPTVETMRERIRAVLEKLPWLVCISDSGDVMGYVYASPYRVRTAYQWSVEVTAYVNAAYRQRRVATGLYIALFDVLRAQGFYNAYAGITLPNPASESLHKKLGFELIGVYHSVGYKFGAWHDVAWFQMSLQPHQVNPTDPLTVYQVVSTPAWEAAMQAGEAIIQF